MRNKTLAIVALVATIATPVSAIAEPTAETRIDESKVVEVVKTNIDPYTLPTKEETATKQINENLKKLEEERKAAEAAAKAEADRIAAERAAQASRIAYRAISYNTDNSDAIAYGQKRNAEVFGEAQWPALFQLWSNESGWRDTAVNYSSGACGIPQFINGCTLGDHVGQIDRGLVYIKNRYGTPNNALAFWNAHHWY